MRVRAPQESIETIGHSLDLFHLTIFDTAELQNATVGWREKRPVIWIKRANARLKRTVKE